MIVTNFFQISYLTHTQFLRIKELQKGLFQLSRPYSEDHHEKRKDSRANPLKEAELQKAPLISQTVFEQSSTVPYFSSNRWFGNRTDN